MQKKITCNTSLNASIHTWYLLMFTSQNLIRISMDIPCTHDVTYLSSSSHSLVKFLVSPTIRTTHAQSSSSWPSASTDFFPTGQRVDVEWWRGGNHTAGTRGHYQHCVQALFQLMTVVWSRGKMLQRWNCSLKLVCSCFSHHHAQRNTDLWPH